MKIVALAWTYLWARPLTAVLNLVLLSLGLASMTLVVLAQAQMDRAFARDLAGIDVVVGAKGSPMQLILSGVFHLEVPPGNVDLAEVQALVRDSRVAQWIPLSLGDSFRGYRIAGTTPDYMAHYGVRVAQGEVWKNTMDAVLGAQVAASTGLAPGQQFEGSHGLSEGGDAHDGHPYRVSGILAACGCVLDRLILTSTESVWVLHEAAHAEDEDDRAQMRAERELTMVLIRYSSPLAAVTFPRFVNSTTRMQAAAPAVEITRLMRMVGVGADLLKGLGLLLLLTGALSVLLALWSAVRERREDLALLRMLGAPPARLATLLLWESLWLALLASVLGLLAGHGLTALLGLVWQSDQTLPLSPWAWVDEELWVPVLALGVAVLAALLPAWSAYRTEAGLLLNAR